MQKTLPERPSLDQLRRQARDLLKQLRQHDPSALERLRESHPEFQNTGLADFSSITFALNHAQLVIAREYGFASWAKLKQRVESVSHAIDPNDHFRLLRGVIDRVLPVQGEEFSIQEIVKLLAHALVVAYREKELWAHVVLNNHEPKLAGRPSAEVFGHELTELQSLDVSARYFGFKSWDTLQGGDPPMIDPLFEQAVEAIVSGNLKKLSQLLQSKPELVTQRSAFGHRCTLLHYLAANGVEIHRQRVPRNAHQIAQILLAVGAAPDALAETYDGGSNQTTLSLLITSAHTHNAGRVRPLLDELIEHGANVNGVENNCHPLQVALDFGYTSTAHALIHLGAKVFSIVQAAGVGQSHEVQMFLDQKPSQKDLDDALYFAVRHGQLNCLELLINAGADVNVCGFFGAPALYWAAIGGHLKAVQVLVDRGADPNLRDERFGANAAGWANESENTEIRDWLLDNGCEASIVEAAAFGRIDLVREHLERDPNSVNTNEGPTALHEAAVQGNVELVQLLLDRGANRFAKDKDELTPLDWAQHKKQDALH